MTELVLRYVGTIPQCFCDHPECQARSRVMTESYLLVEYSIFGLFIGLN